ncbi:helix-turn-helix domain-containing protein [Aeromonas veronii]
MQIGKSLKEKTMKTIGLRIQERLEERGITAADLARKTGLSKPTLSAIIHGNTSDPRISSVYAIAKALNCDPYWLYTGSVDGAAKCAQPEQKKRKTLPRLNRSKFYPRTFFN